MLTPQELECAEAHAAGAGANAVRLGALLPLIGGFAWVFLRALASWVSTAAAVGVLVGIVCVQIGSSLNRRAARRAGLACPSCEALFRGSARLPRARRRPYDGPRRRRASGAGARARRTSPSPGPATTNFGRIERSRSDPLRSAPGQEGCQR